MCQRSWPVLGLVLLGIAGCGASAEKAPKAVVSWGATAARVGETRLRGEIPLAFARRTLRTASDELREQRDTVLDDPGAVRDPRSFTGRIDSLVKSITDLDDAFANDDREAAGRAVGEIAGHTRELRRWARP